MTHEACKHDDMPTLYERLSVPDRERRQELTERLQNLAALRYSPLLNVDGRYDRGRDDATWILIAEVVADLRRLTTAQKLIDLRGELSRTNLKRLLTEPVDGSVSKALRAELEELAKQAEYDRSYGPGYRTREAHDKLRDRLALVAAHDARRSRERLVSWLRNRHPELPAATFKAIENGKHE